MFSFFHFQLPFFALFILLQFICYLFTFPFTFHSFSNHSLSSFIVLLSSFRPFLFYNFFHSNPLHFIVSLILHILPSLLLYPPLVLMLFICSFHLYRLYFLFSTLQPSKCLPITEQRFVSSFIRFSSCLKLSPVMENVNRITRSYLFLLPCKISSLSTVHAPST